MMTVAFINLWQLAPTKNSYLWATGLAPGLSQKAENRCCISLWKGWYWVSKNLREVCLSVLHVLVMALLPGHTGARKHAFIFWCLSLNLAWVESRRSARAMQSLKVSTRIQLANVSNVFCCASRGRDQESQQVSWTRMHLKLLISVSFSLPTPLSN